MIDKPLLVQDQRISLICQGRGRNYEVHLPPNFLNQQHLPIMLVLHGGGSNAPICRAQTLMDATADANRFIVVYPEGTAASGNLFSWNSGEEGGYPEVQDVDDVAFLQMVIEDVVSRFGANPNRVYCTGFSNGAMMTHRLGLQLSNRIAAIAPVSGDFPLPATTSPILKALPLVNMPILLIQGDSDTHCPYEGGVGENAKLPIVHASARASITVWILINRGWSIRYFLKNGLGKYNGVGYVEIFNNLIWLVTLEGTGHEWPSAGKTFTTDKTSKFQANQYIWDYFHNKVLKGV